LAIVRYLVELHGGTVQAKSPGEAQGATFTVKLPLIQGQLDSPLPLEAAPSAMDLSGVRILVVDDEIDTRELIAFVLQAAGAIVTSAASAIEAMPRVAQTQPDIIVSDIGMPEMDGYGLMQQIRSQFPERQIPAIALTAYAGELSAQKAIAAGFQAHIAKPVEPHELIAIVMRLIRS
jgi:CheY-like chemotaxis protein